jgi:hypothetical protein
LFDSPVQFHQQGQVVSGDLSILLVGEQGLNLFDGFLFNKLTIKFLASSDNDAGILNTPFYIL